MDHLTSPRKIDYAKGESVLEHIHAHNIDYHGNQIFMFAHEDQEHEDAPGVDYTMANRFIRNMQILMAKSSEPIVIHMHSYGGDWHAGMAIYDTISHCPNPVTILNYSSAESMSSIIFQAADRRVMMPHSYFMFHYGSEGMKGNTKAFLSYAKEAERNTKQMLDIYISAISNSEHSELSEWSKSRIKRWLTDKCDRREDVYLSAEEAVEYGFADSVFDGNWKALSSY